MGDKIPIVHMQAIKLIISISIRFIFLFMLFFIILNFEPLIHYFCTYLSSLSFSNAEIISSVGWPPDPMVFELSAPLPTELDVFVL